MPALFQDLLVECPVQHPLAFSTARLTSLAIVSGGLYAERWRLRKFSDVDFRHAMGKYDHLAPHAVDRHYLHVAFAFGAMQRNPRDDHETSCRFHQAGAIMLQELTLLIMSATYQSMRFIREFLPSIMQVSPSDWRRSYTGSKAASIVIQAAHGAGLNTFFPSTHDDIDCGVDLYIEKNGTVLALQIKHQSWIESPILTWDGAENARDMASSPHWHYLEKIRDRLAATSALKWSPMPVLALLNGRHRMQLDALRNDLLRAMAYTNQRQAL